MESSLIKGFFDLITDNIFLIIYVFAAIEIYLLVSVSLLIKKHEKVLLDVSDNLLKGFPDAPDRDSSAHVHEKIQSALDFMASKISTNLGFKDELKKNAGKIQERPFYNRHYRIEIFANVSATLVQIFPLLGILGTILAIAQTAFQQGAEIDSSAISNAFVLAMDTTILGISFSILFMVIESTLQPKIERVIFESSEYRKIITKVHLS